jgi:cellulose synthase/poly-beta-1,6-N-acetylglucosamine synthase-like glycosyltransferase
MATLTWIVALLLAVFTIRRYVYIAASLAPSRPDQPRERFSVAVIAAFKDEEFALPDLLRSLDAVDYCSERLSFTLVSDGSSDGTVPMLAQWATGRPNVHVIATPISQGKSVALNLALKAAPPSDLIAIYDADTRPAADQLSLLAGAFENPRVAAASGLLLPANATESLVARYSALETWVYQLVILAGKDRCGSNPPTVGSNCVYLRRELEAIGGFPPGSESEDIELSLLFVKRGFVTRWIRRAESRVLVAATMSRFWRQRTRWTSGLYHSARQARGAEGWLTVAGYADRLALVAAVALVLFGWLRPIWVAVYLAAPVVAAVSALLRAPDTGGKWMYLFVAPSMFVVDIAVSLSSTVLYLIGRRVEWKTDRG